MRRRGPRFEFWPGDWFVLGVSFIISFGLAFVAGMLFERSVL